MKADIKAEVEEIAADKIVSIVKIGNGVNNAIYLLEMINKKWALKSGNGAYTIFFRMSQMRGLDVSTWRTKWINSLNKNDAKLSYYYSELEEDWSKIRILKKYI